MRVRSLTVGAVLLFTAAATAAALHARLVKAEPAIDGTVSEAPTAVRLWFNEPPDPKLSSGALLREDQSEIVKFKFASTDDPLSITSPIGSSLEPGTYLVRWRTVSKDGHGIRGTYRFTYAR